VKAPWLPPPCNARFSFRFFTAMNKSPELNGQAFNL
jgi:hypothetical protein